MIASIASRACNGSRVAQLTEQWKAIQGADVEEQQFCSLAGRMGIDPYDDSEMTEELTRFFEQTIPSPEDPLVRDLTELAGGESVVEQWSWVRRVAGEVGMGCNPADFSLDMPSRELLPPAFGYELVQGTGSGEHTDELAVGVRGSGCRARHWKKASG